MNKTRAIRLSSQEEAKIQKFLALNPFFDFSTLARTAILSFIEKPDLVIRPLNSIPAKITKSTKVRPKEGKSL